MDSGVGDWAICLPNRSDANSFHSTSAARPAAGTRMATARRTLQRRRFFGVVGIVVVIVRDYRRCGFPRQGILADESRRSLPTAQYILLSDEIGRWGGNIQDAKLPARVMGDYVRGYDLVETSN